MCLKHLLKGKYRKVPKFLDTRKLCCNHANIQIIMSFHREICPKGVNKMTNSVDLHCLQRPVC